jgi:hypothetical protein
MTIHKWNEVFYCYYSNYSEKIRYASYRKPCFITNVKGQYFYA